MSVLFSLAAFPPVGGWGEETDDISDQSLSAIGETRRELEPKYVPQLFLG